MVFITYRPLLLIAFAISRTAVYIHTAVVVLPYRVEVIQDQIVFKYAVAGLPKHTSTAFHYRQ